MVDQNRHEYFSYTKEGEFQVKETQCKTCANELPNPWVCKEYSEKKPLDVLKCQSECPKYSKK